LVTLLRGKVYFAESLMSLIPMKIATRALETSTGMTGFA
jgi:hypothetical protein